MRASSGEPHPEQKQLLGRKQNMDAKGSQEGLGAAQEGDQQRPTLPKIHGAVQVSDEQKSRAKGEDAKNARAIGEKARAPEHHLSSASFVIPKLTSGAAQYAQSQEITVGGAGHAASTALAGLQLQASPSQVHPGGAELGPAQPRVQAGDGQLSLPSELAEERLTHHAQRRLVQQQKREALDLKRRQAMLNEETPSKDHLHLFNNEMQLATIGKDDHRALANLEDQLRG